MNARKTKDECETAYQDERIDRIWSMDTEDEYEKIVQDDRVMQSIHGYRKLFCEKTNQGERVMQIEWLQKMSSRYESHAEDECERTNQDDKKELIATNLKSSNVSIVSSFCMPGL